MAQIHISPEEESDLQSIRSYISAELDSPVAATNVIAKIVKSIRNLEVFPNIGTPLSAIIDIPTDYRYLVSGNYLSFYRTDGENVYIVRVLYGKRDYLRILFGELPKSEPDSE